MRLMVRRQASVAKTVTVAGLLIVGLMVAGCGTRAFAGRAGTDGGTPAGGNLRLSSEITFGKSGDVFRPAPARARPALSARQAWDAFAHSPHAAIPRATSVRIGILTMAIGPVGKDGKTVYRAHDVLAYGYSYHQCPVSEALHAKLPKGPCIAWAFLNANTGKLIIQTYQTN